MEVGGVLEKPIFFVIRFLRSIAYLWYDVVAMIHIIYLLQIHVLFLFC